jgi:hypothetical protein
LLRLPAPGLRGTWARAYALLARLVSKIGWDELLKTRSVVFVMEEEYRLQKAQTDHHGHQDSLSHQVIHEDGSVLPGKQRPTSQATTLVADANGGADDDASVRAVKESPTHTSPQASLAANDIPIIRISTESDGDRESEAAAKEQEQRDGQEDNNEEENIEHEDEDPTKVNGTGAVVHDTLEKPIQAAADNSSGADDVPPTPTDAFSFSNKRLCERWLDNLFMVLYEVRSGALGPSHCELNPPSGSASLDHLQGRGSSLQDSTYRLQEDWDGVGDPRRFGAQTEPQRRGKGGVSKMPRFDAVLS